mmetsp:Transcript_44898/g.73140  ORF Transcript_44898/g.73140 Transcript_44898/m.73140 type:complete len:303 (+) Transcript_44898:645-1553(+)
MNIYGLSTRQPDEQVTESDVLVRTHRIVKEVRHVDEIGKIRPEVGWKLARVPDGWSGLTIEWKDGRELQLLSRSSREVLELLGAHITRHNRCRIFQIKRLREMLQLMRTPYDYNSATHEAMLMRLWRSSFPHIELDSRRSQKWSLLGFQGMDPATDFRGMGILGLHNLIYFVETYAGAAQEILAVDRGYPFAAAGINITKMLATIIMLDKVSLTGSNESPAWETPAFRFLCCLYDQPSSFEELYCLAFRLLDRIWVELNAQYFDFPVVLAKSRSVLVKTLQRAPATLLQLQDWLDTSMENGS